MQRYTDGNLYRLPLFVLSNSDLQKMRGVHLAAYFGLWNSMSTLLERRHDIDQRTKMARPRCHGRPRRVMSRKLLLEKNADIEAKNNRWGQTRLSWVAENGHEPVVKLIRLAKSYQLSV
jgi:ankyrin repeat protein